MPTFSSNVLQVNDESDGAGGDDVRGDDVRGDDVRLYHHIIRIRYCYMILFINL